MILFWMKAFKKPTEAQNEALIALYMALNAENQKKINRKNKITIGLYFGIAIFCLVASAAILAFELMVGYFDAIGLVLDIVFFGLSAYATYTSSTWFGAKPYQRLMLCIELAERFLDQQQVVEVDTAQLNIDHMNDNKPAESAENKPTEENASAETETKQVEAQKQNSNTTPTDDKKE